MKCARFLEALAHAVAAQVSDVDSKCSGLQDFLVQSIDLQTKLLDKFTVLEQRVASLDRAQSKMSEPGPPQMHGTPPDHPSGVGSAVETSDSQTAGMLASLEATMAAMRSQMTHLGEKVGSSRSPGEEVALPL